MTKAELIAEVQGKTWYGGILGSLVVEENWAAIKTILYRAHVKVLKTGNVISNCHIYFYTFDEGEATEAAFYRDQTPEQQAGLA